MVLKRHNFATLKSINMDTLELKGKVPSMSM